MSLVAEHVLDTDL